MYLSFPIISAFDGYESTISNLPMQNIIRTVALYLGTHWHSIVLRRGSIMGPSSSFLFFPSKSRLGLWRVEILRLIGMFSPTSLLKTLRSAILLLAKWMWGRRIPQDTLMTPEMEDKYWERIKLGQLNLQRSDARYVDVNGVLKSDVSSLPPLVMYYTPALPPKLRENPRKLKKYYLSAKDYCKWHRMVFPGKDHPTIAQASKLRKMHDPEDLKQIHRISKMLPNGQALDPWTPKYRKKWLKWRESRRKGLEEY